MKPSNLPFPVLAIALASCVVQTSKVEAPNTLTPRETSDGWKLLFDGRTTAGWRGYKAETMPAGWQVRDGALTRVDQAGDIVSDEQYASFELSFEWKISPGGNSGVFFHVTEDHDYVWETGPEYQILDNSMHADGANVLTSAASNYALNAPAEDHTRPVGQWNEGRISVHGAHVEHWLNGYKVLEYELWSPEWKELVAASKFGAMPDYGMRKTGHLALQDHGDEVAYRSIKIKRLD